MQNRISERFSGLLVAWVVLSAAVLAAVRTRARNRQ